MCLPFPKKTTPHSPAHVSSLSSLALSFLSLIFHFLSSLALTPRRLTRCGCRSRSWWCNNSQQPFLRLSVFLNALISLLHRLPLRPTVNYIPRSELDPSGLNSTFWAIGI
ncbi:hypothetical protein QN277_027091 [Acacia crassicarpa]|uniref:Uncharacterized protein n=1 Tax=Acacia crassicarpa TaxID=499986 RepID=A0AAE1MLJ0_9FABA|nr:hypothetical protein QN277_027091 [Acacia crassicarpa]